jgi:hypothetical protein
MAYEPKRDCHWWVTKPPNQKGCRALTELQCKKKGHCSFYETTCEYNHRMRQQGTPL